VKLRGARFQSLGRGRICWAHYEVRWLSLWTDFFPGLNQYRARHKKAISLCGKMRAVDSGADFDATDAGGFFFFWGV